MPYAKTSGRGGADTFDTGSHPRTHTVLGLGVTNRTCSQELQIERTYLWRLKPTVNRVARLNIPYAEDVRFALFTGGQTYTKLDLSQSYQQLPLDKIRRSMLLLIHRSDYSGTSDYPSAFSRHLAYYILLQGISGVVVYIYDIRITGRGGSRNLDR